MTADSKMYKKYIKITVHTIFENYFLFLRRNKQMTTNNDHSKTKKKRITN